MPFFAAQRGEDALESVESVAEEASAAASSGLFEAARISARFSPTRWLQANPCQQPDQPPDATGSGEVRRFQTKPRDFRPQRGSPPPTAAGRARDRASGRAGGREHEEAVFERLRVATNAPHDDAYGHRCRLRAAEPPQANDSAFPDGEPAGIHLRGKGRALLSKPEAPVGAQANHERNRGGLEPLQPRD